MYVFAFPVLLLLFAVDLSPGKRLLKKQTSSFGRFLLHSVSFVCHQTNHDVLPRKRVPKSIFVSPPDIASSCHTRPKACFLFCYTKASVYWVSRNKNSCETRKVRVVKFSDKRDLVHCLVWRRNHFKSVLFLMG